MTITQRLCTDSLAQGQGQESMTLFCDLQSKCSHSAYACMHGLAATESNNDVTA